MQLGQAPLEHVGESTGKPPGRIRRIAGGAGGRVTDCCGDRRLPNPALSCWPRESRDRRPVLLVVLGRRWSSTPSSRPPPSATSVSTLRTIMGNDPPGSFTRVLHPRLGRHGTPPPDVIPVGRSVIVPANGSLPNIVLSPRTVLRIKRALERERFDVLHLHEPMTPAICVPTLALAKCPIVATFHACGRPRLDAARGDGLGLPDGSHRPSDRRVGSGSRLRGALASRRLRRSSRTACSSRRRRAPATARTGSSSSAGTSRERALPGAPAGVARDPPPHRSQAPADRRRSARGAAAPAAARHSRRRHRHPRLPEPRRPDSRAAVREGPRSRRRSAARASGWC